MIMDLDAVRKKMQKGLDFLQDELAQIKTGRATPALVEKILIEAYETKMPLLELATITAPEPNEILVSPFDQTIIRNIERAIAFKKEMGLSPAVDEEVIRIRIAPLTTERREEFLRLLGQRLEIGRVAIRQIRHEERSKIKRMFEDSELNEDEKRKSEEDLQKLTDEMNEKIQTIGEAKKQEIAGGM